MKIKRILAVMLAGAMMLSMAACGGESKEESAAQPSAEQKTIDGNVLEGRNYFDAFVLGAKAGGVYAAVDGSKVLAAPKITVSSGSAAITAVSGVTFKYTLDGSDPRYSKSAKLYTAAVTLEAGQTIRAFAEKAGSYRSGVAEAKNA